MLKPQPPKPNPDDGVGVDSDELSRKLTSLFQKSKKAVVNGPHVNRSERLMAHDIGGFRKLVDVLGDGNGGLYYMGGWSDTGCGPRITALKHFSTTTMMDAMTVSTLLLPPPFFGLGCLNTK